ncbi:MAG: hypothetical protein GY707_05140 [Desulfobacteraceae bacterium]|nr:hypothetical protein [Desulfobacteraceae bacterium]
MTIFTEQFGADNEDTIRRLSNVGNLVPVQLLTADELRTYLSAKNCTWDEDKTFTADETQDDASLIANIQQAFADLQANTIEAITISISMFLLIQQRPEFT